MVMERSSISVIERFLSAASESAKKAAWRRVSRRLARVRKSRTASAACSMREASASFSPRFAVVLAQPTRRESEARMSQRSMGENRSSGEEPTEGLPAEAPPPLSAVEAYEKEIRDRLSSGPTEPGAPGRRWVGAAAVVAALAVAGGVTYAVREGAREERRREDARRYVEAAKNGLARDTRASYAASAEALRASLALDPSNEEAKALLALALAHLAIDYGTGDSDRARAEELARAEGATHSPALEARRILARAEGTG